MSVVCVTESTLPHLAGEPFLDKAEMGRKVIEPGAPRIGRRPVPAPALPGLAIEAVTGERPDSDAIGTREGRMHVDHVDLCVGIAGIDPDIHVDLAAVVAARYLKAVKHDAKHTVLRHQFEVQTRFNQPVEVRLGKGEIPASVEAFSLVERQGEETLDAGLPEIHLFIEGDAARRAVRQPSNRWRIVRSGSFSRYRAILDPRKSGWSTE